MQEITLTQNTFKLFPTVYAVQNDTGRELKMNIQDQTLLLGDTGAVAVQRSDGSYYTIAATLNVLDNAFTADISQALTQPGRTLCQLKVTRSGLVVSSYTFAIMVQPSTDGISEEQLGYSVQDIINAAAEIMNTGLSDAVKQALLQIAAKAVYVDDGGPQYYAELEEALNPTRTLTSISAVYTQSGEVHPEDSLDSLKPDLVVTANYSDGSTATVTTYALSGTLTIGTSTITVTYDGKTTTFSVEVTEGEKWSYNIDDLTKVVGTTQSDTGATCGLALVYTSNNNDRNRRTYVLSSGETEYGYKHDGVWTQTGNGYYPIKVPAGATSLTVSVTPSTQYMQILVRELNNGKYTTYSAAGPTGYNQGTVTRTFSAPVPDNVYFALTFKYDSAGTSYPTEPTGVDITFGNT